MESVTITHGRVCSPADGLTGTVKDVLVRNGRIVAIEDHLKPEGTVVDATGRFVAPGFIDIHTHCYPRAFLGMEPDIIGVDRGCTTIFDAGSSGSDTFEDFSENYIARSTTKVFTLLNVSREGLLHGHELDDLRKVDALAARNIARIHSEQIIGFKARASASVVGDLGLEPIALAARIAHEAGLPLMVHIGNNPPALVDVLGLLDCGDIVTHAFHGKPGGLVAPSGRIIPEALGARARGVKFDIGHGEASFSFETYLQARDQGFDCDFISTDIHSANLNGPVWCLASVLSKLINCGETLHEAIEKCTSAPAQHFGLDGLGRIAIDAIGDLTVFTLEDCDVDVRDSIGDELHLRERLCVTELVCSRGDQVDVLEHTAEQE